VWAAWPTVAAAERPCGHRPQIDFARQDRPTAAQCIDPLDETLVDLLDAGVDGLPINPTT
jgi:hypothetical protein